MTMTASADRPTAARLVPLILISGSTATVAFDLFGQSLSPLMGFAGLAPVPLARQSLQALLGIDSAAGAHLLHYIAGLLAYPLGWLLIARPLAARVAPRLGWLGASAAYGVGLWIFALYVMAHLVAGNPPFLGFTGIAWVALIGHVLFAVVAAWTVRWLEARSS